MRPSSVWPRPIGAAPAGVRPRHRGGARGPRRLKRRLFAELSERQPTTTVLATNTSSIDIDAIARDVTRSRAGARPALLQPASGHGPGRGGPWRGDVAGLREHAAALMRAWGKTPVRCARRRASSSTGWRGPSTARPQRIVEEGVADAGDRRLGAARAWRLPDGAARADRLHRPGRQPRRRHSVWEQTGHDERYAPTAFQRARRGGGSAARAARRLHVCRGRSVERAVPDLELAGRLVGGPVATDPLARTLAMLVNEAVDLVQRGEASGRRRRHGDAARGALPARADRVGPRDRVRRRRRPDRRARGGVPGRALPPEPGSDRRQPRVSDTQPTVEAMPARRSVPASPDSDEA